MGGLGGGLRGNLMTIIGGIGILIAIFLFLQHPDAAVSEFSALTHGSSELVVRLQGR